VFEYTGRTARPLVTFEAAGTVQFEGAPLLQDLGMPDLLGNKREKTRRLRAYEASWARCQAETPGCATELADKEFERGLLSWLRFHKAMLIGEVVPEALRFLQNNPLSKERSAFDHVLVDEYQDLNKAEQILIDVLAASGRHAVFGDDDQSIYSFRHAHPDGIVEFVGCHPGSEDFCLGECRRCPTRVVEMANRLIERNHTLGKPPRLQPRPGNPPGAVEKLQWENPDAEAEGLMELVNHLIDKRGYQRGDILILSPRRILGYSLREVLVQNGFQTHSYYSEEALEDDEAQRAFALLTLLADREDRVALRYWLGHGSQTWSETAYRTLRGHCEKADVSPWGALTLLSRSAE
jgi:superfamily I DNA/RNA helicase